jgi:medium-chain acyl-[acyl-carrier-protein] hydrolase
MDFETNRDKWFFCMKPNTAAATRLFCFPFAGGGASVFNGWNELVDSSIEICALQLPGREARYSEPRIKDFVKLVKDIAQAIHEYQDKPFSIFGYSFGALLAFEVSRELRRQGLAIPVHLFVAACQAPQIPDAYPPISMLGDSEFMHKVEDFFEPQNEAWSHSKLRDFLLPVLRDDIAVCESYVYRKEAPFSCPIDVFAGEQDRSIPVASTRDWSEHSTATVTHHVFPGGHFFIDDSEDEIIALVLSALNQRR